MSAAPSPRSWLPTAAAVGAAWGVLGANLAPYWASNPQYSYGWFVPPLALFLLWKAWRSRPGPGASPSPRVLTVAAALLTAPMLPLLLIEGANPDWRSLSWLLALDAVAISWLATLAAGGRPWWRHFAFAFAFILISVPWPSALENVFVQQLMKTVAEIAVAVINLAGIPAVQIGNLIEVRTGVMGVAEACSGVRSFQSTLMASLFLGELYRFHAPGRLTLVIAGAAIAFTGNVLRTALLAATASRSGLEAIDHWHDPAGFTVFVACFVLLWLIAARVEKSAPEQEPVTATFHPPPRAVPAVVLAGIGLSVLLTELWYRAHESAPAVRWNLSLPEKAEDFRKITIPAAALAQLKCDTWRAASWNRKGAEWMLFFLEWWPGGADGKILARMHRPEICLPASGIALEEDLGEVRLPVAGLEIPARAYRFRWGTEPLHVFYAIWEERPADSPQPGVSDDVMQLQRLRGVLEGRRNTGQQVIEIALTGQRDASSAAAEAAKGLEQLLRVEKVE